MARNTQDIDAEKETTAATTQTESGLDENVAGALSYLFIAGLVFYLIEDDNQFVRFHAAQSIVLGGVFLVAYIGLTIVQTVLTGLFYTGATGAIVGGLVSLVFGLVGLLLGLAGFALWIYLIVRAYQGQTPRVPVVAGIADNLV